MMRSVTTFAFATGSSSFNWLIHLGGPGLILLGLADNSVIPLPGSMDVLTIWLAANRREIWFYYAIMATAGSVLGGYATYHLACKGGKETLEKKLSKRKTDKVYAKFERWGYGAVAIPALLPPPFPIVPALLAAGAMQYPRRKFIAALTVGRCVRYTAVAFLGAHYGKHIASFFSQYYKPALLILIGCSFIGVSAGYIEYRRARKSEKEVPATPPEPKARVA